MSTIICRRLTFGYPGSEGNVFKDLDLVIDTQWRSALVGRNGRGKTTLMRLIQGELAPDRGRIERACPTAYFPRPVVDPEQAVREVVKDAVGPFRRWEREMNELLADGGDEALNRYGRLLEAYEESGGYTIDAGLEAELSALGIDEQVWDKPFANLSGGEQTRCPAGQPVRVARCLAPPPILPAQPAPRAFPLIDEPTNHLDADGRQRVADYLRAKPGFLLVSPRPGVSRCLLRPRRRPEPRPRSRSSERRSQDWRVRFRQRLARAAGRERWRSSRTWRDSRKWPPTGGPAH